MKRVFLLVASIFILVQCDDGNFDEPSFVFDNNIDDCGNMIIFNIGVDDSEALILDVDFTNTADIFYKTERTNEEFNLSNRISYRVFNGAISSDYFCQDIPPTSPIIVNEWNGSGTLIVNNTIVLDDNDGVEELDHDLDTDGDDIPNYLDKDDDNDGVLTSLEINSDGSVLDTDGDDIPNYLEEDDDNDGVLTINEPADLNGDTIKDYLQISIAAIQNDPGTVASNTYTLSYTTIFTIENMSLSNGDGNSINYSNYNYGVKTGDISITD